MISPATIKERLSSVFEPAQANVLTEIFSESYTDLVKTGDFKDFLKKKSRIGIIPCVEFKIDLGEKNRPNVDRLI